MHLVEHFEAVAEMKVIRSIDDFELGVGAQSIGERSDAGVEVNKDIIAGGEYQAAYFLRQREFSRIEGLSPHERFGCGSEAADSRDPRFESGHFQRRPATEGMAE